MPLTSVHGPLTRAERSAFRETSTHADVLEFIDAVRKLGGTQLHVTDFGNTPEGRILPLLVLSGGRHFTPREALDSGLPIVLVQCGIHAGEVEGKEAALMLVRDILGGRHGDLLSRLTLLVVPLFNADGNDRIDAEHRKLEIEHLRGQIGPQGGVGTRENAAGINLNRDYMRQDGTEMRLMQSGVCQPWNPHLVIDCHTTNGSIHRFAMTYDIPHVVDSGRREPIEFMRTRLLPAVQAAVKANDGLDSFWYGNFLRDEGGQGLGWITYPHHPRFGGNYRGLTNRLDLLLETYSYLPFAERVRATYGFLRETLNYIATQSGAILDLLGACSEPPPQIAVRYRLEAFDNSSAHILTREPYTLSGAPIEVTVPHYARFVGEQVVKRPLAYAVPRHIADHLARHGLQAAEPRGPLHVNAEIATVRKHVAIAGRTILEAQTATHLDVEFSTHRRLLPQDWRLIYTGQQRGAIAVYLCEAGSDDGLIACGLLDKIAPGSEFPAWRVHEVGN
jgi:Zinc carboxypeptidase